MRTRPLAIAAAWALPAAIALTGCSGAGSGESTGATRAGTTGGAISVRASDTACELSRAEAPAGTVEFTITNSGTKVNEFYVYAEGDRILGEVENLAPGLTRTFHVDLPEPGTYQTACKPGMVGDGIRAPFTVTGASAAALSRGASLEGVMTEDER